MKYLTNLYETSTKEDGMISVTIKEREISIPKNVVNADKFSAIFKTALESATLERLNVELSALEEEDETIRKELNAVIDVFKANRGAIEAPAPTDVKFVNALVWAVCGLPRGAVFEDAGKVKDLLNPALKAEHDNKAIKPDTMKAIKTFFENFANKYLATTNESGMFKKFHVEFKTSTIKHIIMLTEKPLKWGKDGITMSDYNPNSVLLEVLTSALHDTFKFDAKKARNKKATIIL